MHKQGRKNLKIVLWSILIISVLALWNYANNNSRPSSPSSYKPKSEKSYNTYHSPSYAYIQAETFIKKKLKSPSTAEFPGVFEKKDHIVSMGGSKYKISSWVDSQNSYGAMMRTNFSCVIEFEGNKVSCTELAFN